MLERASKSKIYTPILNESCFSYGTFNKLTYTSDHGDRPAEKFSLLFGTVNVNIKSNWGNKVAEMLTCWKVDLCCLQETRWKRGSAHLVKGKNSTRKFFWKGDQSGFKCVGIMLAKKLINNVIFVTMYDHYCLWLRFLVETIIISVISCYPLQTALSTEEKDAFYNKTVNLVAAAPDEDEHSAGFEGVHRAMIMVW